jgi:predicted nucleic acid-binding protein
LSASSDAGPLIWLAGCGNLHLLEKLYSGIVIPEAVYEEVVTRGIEEGYEDARIIKKAVEEGWIRVLEPGGRLMDEVKAGESRLGVELGEGEREAMALALVEGARIFLTDDEDAHRTGKSLGLESKGVLYVLLMSVRDGLLDKKQARVALGKMLGGGFWLSPRIIHSFHEALDKL